MAIKSFKDIVDNKGYKVVKKDREVFEEGLQKSFFGLGIADEIEFILYDSNDNKLPQGESGKKVRYIKLDSANITDYFLLTKTQSNLRQTRASEFVVDVEKLIREAGYSNGVFKTQVTLINRRAGSEDREGDKLWIHEISPSRTEIRVLPTRGKKMIEDLEERYKTFVNEKEFRDDTIYFVKQLAESVSVEDIRKTILTEKGSVLAGEQYIKLIQKEFKISNFTIFLTRIRNLFLEATNFYIDNRYSNPNEERYGRVITNNVIPVHLALEKINEELISILLQCIDKLLLKRNIQDENILTEDEQKTIDKLKEITKSAYNDDIFSSEGLPDEKAVVGCMDTRALNYNPLAKREDGSCIYEQEEEEVLGCTDKTAKNYNPLATKDDGSCKPVDNGELLFGQKYYVWSTRARWSYKSENGSIVRGKGLMYETFSINHYKGTFEVEAQGDVRQYPKPLEPQTKKYKITYNRNIIVPRGELELIPTRFTDPFGWDDRYGEGPNYPYGGLARPPIDNLDDGYNDGIGVIQSFTVSYKNVLGKTVSTRSLAPGDSIEICAQIGSVTLPSTALSMQDKGSCVNVIDRVEPDLITTLPTRPSVSSGGGGGGGSRMDEPVNEFNYSNESMNQNENIQPRGLYNIK